MKNILLLFLFTSSIGFSQRYFQQQVNYKIEVKLDDKTHFLTGFEEFEYINKSPDTLKFIYIHLWPNAYENKNTAMSQQLYRNGNKIMQNISEKNKGYIDSLDFKINGKKAKLLYNLSHRDIAKLILNNPLKPGEKIKVSTPFRVKIPSGKISRLGHIGESYQITQWYPKPAVYDKDGWHHMPYLTQGEFYSEFGFFDVSITIPENYVVGATGDLQTKSELKFLNKKVEETKLKFKNDSFKKVVKSNIKSSEKYKTIRYTENMVHDFAWFADKRYEVLKGEVELPHSKRKITTWTMFTPKNALKWRNSIEYVNDGTYYYSKWNGDYPYNNVTAVDGTISAGGGMEYPTITVIGNATSLIELETVIVHEVGHNWFYGILGSNERVHPWMDEGLNTANEIRYMETKYPNNSFFSGNFGGAAKPLHITGISHHQGNDLTYNFMAGEGKDQPIETHSNDLTPTNYGAIAYAKTGLVFSYLRDYLGDKLYDKCMQEYYNSFYFMHPQPLDLRKVFEFKTGKNLNWFFDDIIKTTKQIDYRVSSVKRIHKSTQGNNFKVKIKNKGQIKVPVRVDGFIGDSLVESIWIELDKEEGYFKSQNIDKVVIDYAKKMPETNRANNTWEKSKLFNKVEPINFEFLFGDNEVEKNAIWGTPIFGVNAYDNFMLGALFHNISLPKSNVEFTLAPMYSFGRENLSGFGDIHYNHVPTKLVSKMEIGVKAQTFMDEAYGNPGDYYTVKPYLNFKLGKPNKRVNYKQELNFTGVYVKHNYNNSPNYRNIDPSLVNFTQLGYNIYMLNEYNTNYGGIAEYAYSLKKGKRKTSFNARVDYITTENLGDGRLNVSLTMVNKLKYWEEKKKDIEIRFFLGKSYSENNSFFRRRGFALGGQSGFQDYFYEHLMFGRNETRGLYAQQRISNHGNFRTVSDLTSNFMFATNVYVELPYIPLVGLFADFGLIESIGGGSINGGKVEPIADLGLGLRLWEDNFSLYYPLWESENLNNSLIGAEWYNKIRVNINLNIYSYKELFKLIN